MTRAILILLPAMALLSACMISPRAYETEPVEVSTAAGIVTCQLYHPNMVAWDRSIDRPDGMTVSEADTICRTEGQRQKAA